MNLPDIFNLGQVSASKLYIDELLKTNVVIEKYGLSLSLEDVKLILNVRDKTLNSYGRIDLSIDVIKKLIDVFSSSTFIDNKNYVYNLNELQEAFYYLKNETEDKISDDKIIELMKDLFENSCGGSFELMLSHLEEFSKNFRSTLE